VSAGGLALMAKLSAWVTAILGAVAAALTVLSEDSSAIADIAWAAPLLIVLAGLGLLITRHDPENRIGPGMCLLAAMIAVGGLSDTYFRFETDGGGRLAGYEIGAWFTSWLTLAAILLPITVFFLICPDGKLPSRRWRPVLFFELGTIGILAFTGAFASGPLEGFPDVDNPVALPVIGPALGVVRYLAYLLLIPGVGLSGAALVHRFRRSHGRERQQLKWLALAAVAAFLVFVLSWPASILIENIWDITPLIVFSFLPIATGIAILRHQLYDIDRILNRTLVYALLTAALGAVYLGVVVGLQAVFSNVAGGSDLAIAITTLLVAALFLPARRRVQDIVDRHFNRRTYDAARTIDDFSARLRQQIDLDTLRYELLAVTEETMQPSSASIWLRRRA
jgi:hypothetical protein